MYNSLLFVFCLINLVFFQASADELSLFHSQKPNMEIIRDENRLVLGYKYNWFGGYKKNFNSLNPLIVHDSIKQYTQKASLKIHESDVGIKGFNWDSGRALPIELS